MTFFYVYPTDFELTAVRCTYVIPGMNLSIISEIITYHTYVPGGDEYS